MGAFQIISKLSLFNPLFRLLLQKKRNTFMKFAIEYTYTQLIFASHLINSGFIFCIFVLHVNYIQIKVKSSVKDLRK